MKNLYYNELMELLLSHPEGMRVGHVARCIYNSNCDLFEENGEGLFRGIYDSVYRFLWRESRKRNSPFARMKWGTYGLRRHFVVQLELVFDDWEDEGIRLPEEPPKAVAAERPAAYMLDLFA